MINLLPQSAKKKLFNGYRLRLSVVILLATLILQIFAGVVFAPSYLAINGTTKTLSAELAAKKQLTPPGGDEAQKKLAQIKGEIALLKPASGAEVLPSQLLADILSYKPDGIGIASYAYANTGGKIQMQLTGTASTREDLLAFQRNLKENPHFTDNKYSQSFIIQKTDISFQLTVPFK